VSGLGASTIEVGQTSTATLTLNDGTSISGGKLLLGNAGNSTTGTLDVEAGTGTGGHGATLSGVQVGVGGTGIQVAPSQGLSNITSFSGGVIEVGQTTTATLTLEDGTSISGVGIAIGSNNGTGTLDIEKGTTGPGATLDALTVDNFGAIDIGTNATLSIGYTVELDGTGTVSMASGSQITDNGSAATLDNFGNTISGQGTIGGSHLQLNNQVTIDADIAGQALILDTASSVINNGLLEATNGATLDIRSDVAQGPSQNSSTAGSIEAHGKSVVELEAITVNSGKILIDAGSTLEIEHGTTTLTGVDVENSGTLQIDAAAVSATLVLGTGSSIDGNINIGNSGELDISGGTFNGNVTIYDSGVFDIDTAMTLSHDVTIVLQGGSFLDTGLLAVADGASVKLSGANNFGTLDIGKGSVLTLDHAYASVVDFGGHAGTLVLKEPTGFTDTIKGLASGDVIDLAGVKANTVTLDGTTLKINGVATSFSIAGGLPTGDVLVFKDDGSGGTDIKVEAPIITISGGTASGVEGSAISLDFGAAWTAGVNTMTIGGIPADAKLIDSYGVVYFPSNGSITVSAGAALSSGLWIVPGDDNNFNLSLTLTGNDSDGYQYSATTTETVTVTPPQPSVSWAAGAVVGDASGSKIGIALTAGVTGATSDHNVIAAETISGIQVGATLTDGTHTFKATTNSTTANVLGWNLANLSITPANASNFTLTATVTEADSDNPAQTNAASASLSIVTNTDWTQPAGGDWRTAGDWDHGVPSTAVNAVFDSSFTGATSTYVVNIAASTTAEVHGLTFNDKWTDLLDYGHLIVDTAFTENAGYIVVENAVFGGGKNNAATMTVSGGLTVHGGTIEVIGGTNVSGTNWASGTLTISGALVVDGGKVVTDAGTSTSGGTIAPGGTLTATSINVETGGTVELHGPVNVTGVIETTGGNLIVGSEAQFNNTKVLTFGGTSGTITIEDNSSAAYKAPDIAGFGAGDVVDLANFDPAQTVFSESISGNNLVLTATDGSPVTTLTFDSYHGGLNFASDGNGGTDITYSPFSQTYWTVAKSADWTKSQDWSNGVPTSNLDALIENSVTGATSKTAYTITVSSHDAAHTLTMNDTYGTLNDNSSLTVSGSLSLSAGTIDVGDAATSTAGSTTVSGGLIDVTGDDWGGTFNAGALSVSGGKVMIEAGDFWDDGGTLKATSVNVETGGTVELHATVQVSGVIETTGGNLIVGSDTDFTGTHMLTFGGDGGIITFDTSSSRTYTAPDISGFGHAGAHPDVVDLIDFDSNTVFTESSSNGNLTLTATEYGNTTTLTFDNFNGSLNFASDGHGGVAISDVAEASAADIGTVDTSVSNNVVNGTITATDPHSSGTVTTTLTPDGANYIGNFSVREETTSHNTASVAFSFNTNGAHISSAVTQSYVVAVSEGSNTILHETVSVSVGTTHSDNFVFTPGIGADTIINFNASGGDTIDLTHFTNITTVAQLQAATTTDAHGDEVINLGNHDSITIAGMNAQQFHNVMGSAFHLA
jgi:hypothetical protein